MCKLLERKSEKDKKEDLVHERGTAKEALNSSNVWLRNPNKAKTNTRILLKSSMQQPLEVTRGNNEKLDKSEYLTSLIAVDSNFMKEIRDKLSDCNKGIANMCT